MNLKTKQNRKPLVSILLAFCLYFTCAEPSFANTQGKIPVIMYHNILNSGEISEEQKGDVYTVTTENFEKHMKYLYDNKFRSITADELLDFLYNGKALPEKSIVIQFDDGYYSNIIRAYPILKKYGFKATIFSNTIKSVNPQMPFSPEGGVFISKDIMKNTSDVFTYASHTHDLHPKHSDYSWLVVESKEEVVKDIKRSLEIVDNKTVFTYPYGQYSDEIIEAVKEAGIKLAFTTNMGYVTKSSDPYKLNRFGVYAGTPDGEFQQYVNGRSVYPVKAGPGYIRITPGELEELRTPSPWAAESIKKASALKIAPDYLINQYSRYVTRAEFCAFAAKLFEAFSGGEITESKKFGDTTDVNVEKMAGLGIITGMTDTVFKPNEYLTREQGAVIMARLAAAAGAPFPEKGAAFYDNHHISSWAAKSVGQVNGAGIINGIGDNLFAPKYLYTREQCIVIMVRLFEYFYNT